jgi:Fe-S cluster assembly iron-binding protein IscA
MGMALDEPEDNEQPVDVNGIGVLVQDPARAFVDNMVIDYVTEPHGEGFVIHGAGGNC